MAANQTSFKKGVANGRKNGSKNKKNPLIQAIKAEAEIQGIDDPELHFWQLVYREGLGGDSQCRNLIAERISRPVKSMTPLIDLGAMSASDEAKATRIRNLLLSGKISPEQCSAALDAIDSVFQVKELKQVKELLVQALEHIVQSDK